MKPILFSTPMVQAILNGSKTQTRRVIKPQSEHERFIINEPKNDGQWINVVECGHKILKCPYGKIGDILWVRETWCKNIFSNPVEHPYMYKASLKNHFTMDWKPSIHMPKAACRLFLEITDIRVERLQDISEADIKAEGIQIPVNNGKICWVLGQENSALSFMPDVVESGKNYSETVFRAFWAERWCKINGRQSWDSNPWVWVIDFKRKENPA